MGERVVRAALWRDGEVVNDSTGQCDEANTVSEGLVVKGEMGFCYTQEFNSSQEDSYPEANPSQ